MEYWTDDGLSTVASGVGTPLYADRITKDCSRLDFARYENKHVIPLTVFVKKHNSQSGAAQAELGAEMDTENDVAGLKSAAGQDIPKRGLWDVLKTLSNSISDEPWLVLGDFNAVIDDSEVCGRAADTSVSMAEFHNCILDTGLLHLPFTGCPFTWHNCSEGTRSLWKRLDRMLVNEMWLETWPDSSYINALPSISTIPHSSSMYLETRITGTAMYEVVYKLKALKNVFRQQRKLKGNLTENVRLAKGFLDKAQELFAAYKEDYLL
ncbi:hypothetical protein Sango_3000100 [Sesamum angolense]|uniref:Endonuclease/exonuclease/phosphatase domain-containing protein n=1 Tax=Sesamum angolense TaxID=2727404 RepID=A0AAE1VX88_9LAMI|nr:hypothetical protein Sango_3000100 [Sesamum angolense]